MPYTVLLIVDSNVDRATYKQFLNQDDRESYQLVEFEQSQDAIDWYQNNGADIILLTDQLQDIDGLECLRKLQQQQSNAILPVIMLIKAGNVAIASEALKLGAQDYLEQHKINQDTLPQLVRSVAQQVQLKRQLMSQQTQHQHLVEMARGAQHSEGTLQLLVKYAPVSIAMFDREMRYIIASQSWVEHHSGQSKTIEEYIGRSHYEIYPDIPERWRQVHQRCLAGAIEKCEEDLFVKTDAPSQWVRWEVRPWYTTDAAIGGIIIFVEEITSRKHSEIALAESEARLCRAIQNAPIPILLEAEDGEVLLLNQTWTDLTGYTHADIPTLSDWTEKAYGGRKDEIQAIVQERFSSQHQSYAGEFNPRTKSGDTRIWDFYTAPLGHLSDGRQFSVCMAVDCTERRLAQAQLQAILDNAQVIVYLKDREGRYLLVNQCFATLSCLQRDEVLGRTDFDLFPAETAQLFHQHDQYVLTTGTSLQFEETLPLSIGSRTFLALKFPLQDINGQIYAVCGISTDITELTQTKNALRQSNEQLQVVNQDLDRANQVKDAFLRMMSHELRSPLDPVLGMVDALQKEVFGSLTDRQKRAVSSINNSAHRLLTLINSILQLVDLETSKVKLNPEAISVTNLCETTLTVVQSQAEAKMIQLHTNIAPGITFLQADGNYMRQILTLLLENAIKFTPKGGSVTLDVRVCAICCPPKPVATLFMQFAIQDTGIGISSENLQHLFQFFTQLDDPQKRSYDGIGIGLALVRRLVELHHGHLTVESQLGQGSRFIVNIPV